MDISFFNCLDDEQTRQQIVYLEPRDDLVLTDDDYGFQCLEEANLKIVFKAFKHLNGIEYRKLFAQAEPSIMRNFDEFMSLEKDQDSHFTPTKESSIGPETYRGNKHVQFLDFKVNANKTKPKRKLEDSIMLPSKHSVITNSPNEEIEFMNYKMGNNTMNNKIDETFESDVIEISEKDVTFVEEMNSVNRNSYFNTILEAKRQLKLRSTPKGKNVTRQLVNEEEVKENLTKLTQDFAQSVEDYQNDTDEILQKLANLEQNQGKFELKCETFKAKYVGLTSTEKVQPEARRIFDEINYENMLDIKDLEDLNSHKRKELSKLKKQMEAEKKTNQKLRANLDLALDDEQNVRESIDKISKQNRKQVQPMIGENEMLVSIIKTILPLYSS